MSKEITITITAGFFPPPGVPFTTDQQRDLAVAMHNAGLIKVEINDPDLGWLNWENHGGCFDANRYRLAPPEPIKAVFDCECIYDAGRGRGDGCWHDKKDLFLSAAHLADKHPGKKFRFVARGELTEIIEEKKQQTLADWANAQHEFVSLAGILLKARLFFNGTEWRLTTGSSVYGTKLPHPPNGLPMNSIELSNGKWTASP